MSMRVATFAMSGSLVRAALAVQAEESAVTLQQASGLKSSDWSGYGAEAGRIVDLQTSLDRATAYADAANQADTRVEQLYTAVGSIIDAVSDFKATLTSFSATLTDSGEATMASEASSVLETVVSLLNSRFEGDYLFSGGANSTAAVDLDAVVGQAAPSSADTSWYQGGDVRASTRVGDDRSVSWGATADEEGFEKAIRALAMIAAGNVDDADVSEALDLLTEAIDGMTTTQTRLSLSAASLESAAAEQEDYQSFVTSLITDTTSVDVAEVSVRLSTLQTQLEAAYSAIGTIQSLSLVDYLR